MAAILEKAGAFDCILAIASADLVDRCIESGELFRGGTIGGSRKEIHLVIGFIRDFAGGDSEQTDRCLIPELVKEQTSPLINDFCDICRFRQHDLM